MALEPQMNTDFNMVVGTVAAVIVKKLDKPDVYDNTHRATFSIEKLNRSGDPNAEKDSIWFAAGSMKGDEFTGKDKDGNWVQITKGADIKFPYDKNGDWYNVKRSQMTVMKTGQPPRPKKESSPDGGYDNTGVRMGHLQTCVEAYLGKTAFKDGEKYAEMCIFFNNLTDNLMSELKQQDSSLTEYELGAISGRAVKSAAENCKGKESSMTDYARNAMSSDVRSTVLNVLKGDNPKKEYNENLVQQEVQENEIDFDDDIPF